MEGNNLKSQLASVPVQLALAVALGLLYAVVLRDAWNWFLVPAIPTIPAITYPLAYGILILIDAVLVVVYDASPKTEDASNQADHPIAWPLTKAAAKAIVALLVWGLAAIVHAIVAA